MTEAPWLRNYPGGLPSHITPEYGSVLDAFDAHIAENPDRDAIAYFDGAITYRELDDRACALAAALSTRGFGPGDRLALYLQNDPAFVVGLLAAWRARAVAVPVNPMNKAREVTYLLQDSGAAAVLTLDGLYHSVLREVVGSGSTAVRQVFVASALDDQTRNDRRVLPATAAAITGPDVVLLSTVYARFAGQACASAPTDPASPAVLTYTSGTTGVPKGAINTHRGLAFAGQIYREWMGLGSDDVILGIAPLFHITGLVGHVCAALVSGCRLVLVHRFEGSVVLDAIREHRPTFTVGAITAFTNLAGAEGATKEDFASLRAVYSGGAPIAPELRERIRDRIGIVIHNIYGMTETTSPAHAVPLGVATPVDPGTGALSIGLPVFNTRARILDDDGTVLPPGKLGELAISGPQVVPGYWNKPVDTADRITGGEIRTGDVGLMDAEGWFYLVDRKSDVIIASGYKVWPREVEDVLLGHPAVREAAVVGVPDEYRGQTVRAVVSLRAGAAVTDGELIAFCRDRLAAYKCPRAVEFVGELPKNAAGKVLRRGLR
ncbi:class I adenylate-forming enzyme family protein [Amycolatopsis jiangsuensis]|uniref:Long-chain acyl-CoA synthetase n=1 Tax=Amycolatopsis jiangsuensis TaxID=1181879 RepID=A0A840J6K4_9PSEU|nr:AMP-binding protein [Amycolatopsis jiangsuensis]MBB4689660.1 long-chain acyl-CoA synthetase [Amycolatopsis jiangsuensis]